MNKKREKELIAALSSLIASIDLHRGELEIIRDEEQEYYDNLPENLQSGERAERSQSFLEGLETLLGCFDEIGSSIGDLEGL